MVRKALWPLTSPDWRLLTAWCFPCSCAGTGWHSQSSWRFRSKEPATACYPWLLSAIWKRACPDLLHIADRRPGIGYNSAPEFNTAEEFLWTPPRLPNLSKKPCPVARFRYRSTATTTWWWL